MLQRNFINLQMHMEQKISNSDLGTSSQVTCSVQSQLKNPMQSLSLQQIERLLDDVKLQPKDQKLNEAEGTGKEDNFQSDQTQQQEPGQSQDSCKQQLTQQDIVVSKNDIIFGQPGLVPGAIDEVDFSVSLNFGNSEVEDSLAKTNQQPPSYILRIIAICKNEQFDGLDEYVFSVRSNNCYEYYQEIRFKIKRGERADIKVAVKIPSLKQNYAINGLVEVRLQDLQPIYVPVVAKCIAPEVICLKMLYNEEEGVNVIKIPAKKCQQRTPPIPFKNLSPFNLCLEAQTISNEDFSKKPYDIVVQNFVNCPPNSQFFVNMQLRENVNFSQIFPTRQTIRKILLLKIRNSSVVFHFPIEVTVYEGQNLEGN